MKIEVIPERRKPKKCEWLQKNLCVSDNDEFCIYNKNLNEGCSLADVKFNKDDILKKIKIHEKSLKENMRNHERVADDAMGIQFLSSILYNHFDYTIVFSIGTLMRMVKAMSKMKKMVK